MDNQTLIILGAVGVGLFMLSNQAQGAPTQTSQYGAGYGPTGGTIPQNYNAGSDITQIFGQPFTTVSTQSGQQIPAWVGRFTFCPLGTPGYTGTGLCVEINGQYYPAQQPPFTTYMAVAPANVQGPNIGTDRQFIVPKEVLGGVTSVPVQSTPSGGSSPSQTGGGFPWGDIVNAAIDIGQHFLGEWLGGSSGPGSGSGGQQGPTGGGGGG